jgi:hypothetical protein
MSNYDVMNRRVFTTSALAFGLISSLRALPATSRTKDIDAVYSLILAAECTCCAKPKNKLFIDAFTFQPANPIVAARTYTALERAQHVPGSLSPFIYPPVNRLEDAAELVADFTKQNIQQVPIQDRLKLPRPYHLVTPEESRQYFVLNPQGNVYDPSTKDQVATVPAKVRREFKHATGIYSLSSVGFNSKQTLSLFAQRSISNGCSSESWYVLEKTENGWVQLKWPTSSMSVCA